MAQPFVFSPSNMGTYRTCPRRFMGQSITKQIPWRASKQKSRGSLVHNDVQKALRSGLQAVPTWQEGVDPHYTAQMVQDSRRVIAAGGQMFIEHEMCINQKFRRVDWWDDNAFLRARADVLILPSLTSADVIDIKTGKKWDDDDFQLRVETLLVHLIYNRPIVNYAYWYVDLGDSVDGSIDFSNGLAPVQDIIDLIKDMRLAMRDNYYVPKRNKFCGWCAFDKTPDCGL